MFFAFKLLLSVLSSKVPENSQILFLSVSIVIKNIVVYDNLPSGGKPVTPSISSSVV